jgi:hypothetical protein
MDDYLDELLDVETVVLRDVMLVASKVERMEVLKVGERAANLVSELADLMVATMGGP